MDVPVALDVQELALGAQELALDVLVVQGLARELAQAVVDVQVVVVHVQDVLVVLIVGDAQDAVLVPDVKEDLDVTVVVL